MSRLATILVAGALFASACANPRGSDEAKADALAQGAVETVPVAGSGALLEPSDPAQSLYKRTYAILPDADVTFTGSTAGVAVYRMGDGSHPERIGGLVLPGSVSGLTLVEGASTRTLAACTGPTGVALVDVSGAATGTLTLLTAGRWASDAGCHSAWRARSVPDGRVFIACGTSGVLEADLSDPAKPRVTRMMATGGYVRDLVILQVGDPGPIVLAAAAADAGVAVVSFPVSGDPDVMARADTPGDARALTLVGATAVVADGPAGLLLLDLKDPKKPAAIGTFDPQTSDMARGVVASDGRAYLCLGDSGLAIVGIEDPGHPVLLGTFDPGRAFNHAALVGNLLYGANDDAGLMVLDVSKPATPVQIFPTPG